MLLEAVFFDRDGVLIEDKNYLSSPDEITWIEGARELIARLSAADVKRFVVTNQSGVARGFFAVEDVVKVHDAMSSELGQFASITDFKICPHLSNGRVIQYAIDCHCRKPKPGMIIDLVKRYGVDPNKSCMIGDKESDILAARAAGMKGFRFYGGNLESWFIRTVLVDGGFEIVGLP